MSYSPQVRSVVSLSPQIVKLCRIHHKSGRLFHCHHKSLRFLVTTSLSVVSLSPQDHCVVSVFTTSVRCFIHCSVIAGHQWTACTTEQVCCFISHHKSLRCFSSHHKPGRLIGTHDIALITTSRCVVSVITTANASQCE